MNKFRKIQFIDSLTLKLLAMAFMLCDHMWATVIPGTHILTDIGRLAFPIFAFQIVDGYFHTKDIRRYILRMSIFALISEIPFNLMMGGVIFYPYGQSVMCTFLIAIFGILIMEKARNTGKLWKYLLTVAVVCAAGLALGFAFMVDYYGFGVLTVFMFYICRNLKFKHFDFGWLGQLIGLYLINAVFMGGEVFTVTLFSHSFEIMQQGLAMLSLIPIWLYNGKPGYRSKPIQYICYAFYPAHMLVLALISMYA